MFEWFKKLLAEAGYPDGVDVTWVLLNTTEYKQIAEAVQAMMAEVNNYFEDIGLQPKGMDPRRLAWLLRQEPETARTLALAERADRLSREGSIELAQRLDAERAQAERDMAPEPGAWDMADHRDIPGPTREEVERYYGEFQAVAGKDRAGEPVAPQGRPASEDEAANRFLASTRPEGAGAAAEVPRTGSRGDAALAGDRWEPLYSPRDDRQTGFDFDQKRSQRGTDDLPLFGKGGRERPAEPPARPTERPEPRPAPEGDLFAARPETPAREPVREPVREPTPGREPTMIQDAGEKIGGARKDLWAERGLRLRAHRVDFRQAGVGLEHPHRLRALPREHHREFHRTSLRSVLRCSHRDEARAPGEAAADALDHDALAGAAEMTLATELIAAGLKDSADSDDVLSLANGTSALIYVNPRVSARKPALDAFLREHYRAVHTTKG